MPIPPVRWDALHRGMMIAQDSGNRANESHLAGVLGRLEAQHGDPLAALDHFTVAIRNYHDAGNTHNMRAALAALAAFLDRLGFQQSAGWHGSRAGFLHTGSARAANPPVPDPSRLESPDSRPLPATHWRGSESWFSSLPRLAIG